MAILVGDEIDLVETVAGILAALLRVSPLALERDSYVALRITYCRDMLESIRDAARKREAHQ